MIGLATVLAAFLLFAIQPLVAKSLLPRHGGAPAVWATCLAYFQVAVLAGYLQAYAVARRPLARIVLGLEALLALALLAARAAAIGSPLAPGFAAPGGGAFALALDLAVTTGPAVLLLATASPMLQAAMAARARSPWPLFAASNAGSLAALLVFPYALEPAFGLSALGWAWGLAFAMWLVLATLALVGGRGVAGPASALAPDGPRRAVAVGAPLAVPARPVSGVAWMGWSALPAALLVATGQHIGQEVPTTPAAMIAPLAVYLATFVAAFWPGADGARVARFALPHVPIAIALAAMAMRQTGSLSPLVGVAVPLYALAVAGLCCHGALSRARPASARLEAYYLAIAAGGAAGGLVAAFVPPLVLPAPLEHPMLLLLLAWVAAVPLVRRSLRLPDEPVNPRWAVLSVFAIAMSAALLAEDRALDALGGVVPALDPRAYYVAVSIGVMLAVERLRRLPPGSRARPDRAVWRAVACAVLLVIAHVALIVPWAAFVREPRHLSRSYFGTLRVVDRPVNGTAARMLYHGAVRHGLVWLDPSRRDEPASYYGATGGLGCVLGALRSRSAGRPLAIGGIGLGVGALAQHVGLGDRLHVIELDPRVIALAEGEGGHFDLLARARARGADVRITVGDGRVMLAASDLGNLDALVVDAFTGGEIPTHLLTREAVALYAARLAPRGVIAFHVSSDHFDLRPVLEGAARDLGLASAYLADPGDPARGTDKSLWMALARDGADLPEAAAAELPQSVGGMRTWTDDHASVVGLTWR